MNTCEQINLEALHLVLDKMLGVAVIDVNYQMKHLHGGSVGEVILVTGTAKTVEGGIHSYAVILKIQKKWERFGDMDSWRREYDLYQSDIGMFFSDSFSWSKCYHAEINNDKNQIWMEYIDGISGNDLTVEALEHAAFELGRFQGKLYQQKPTQLQSIHNLGEVEFMKRDYDQWNPQTVEYLYIRSEDCTIPEPLCQMLIHMDQEAEAIFEKIKRLPIVLCHRDFWLENIIHSCGKSILIDWDTAGWGYLGEDIASLIVDETNVNFIEEYYHRLIPAYYRGVSEYMDISWIEEDCIHEMILIKFGYRLIHRYMFFESSVVKNESIAALQKIYEIKDKFQIEKQSCCS